MDAKNGLIGEAGELPSEMWARLVELSSDFVCVCLKGCITFLNPAGAKMVGLSGPEEAIGRPVADFFHPNYKEFIEIGLDAFAEEEAGVPLRFLRDNNESIDVTLKVSVLESPEGDCFMLEAKDITEVKKASEALRAREEKLQGILNAVTDAIITIDQKGTIQSFNPAAQKIFGYGVMDVLGKNVSILMPDPYRSDHDGFLARYLRGGGTGKSKIVGTTTQLEAERKDGTVFPIEIGVSELRHGDQRIFTGIIRDITERLEAEQRIRHLAHHDSLTGLPNRHLFNDRLDEAIKRGSRSSKILALMFVDLDKFKPINDDLGHEAGDAVLKAVAERLQECVRASDTVARVGGDEFVIVLEGLDDGSAAGMIGEKILERFKDPVPFKKHKCVVGASIGVSLFPQDARRADDLVRCADDAMYRVKSAGRNACFFFRDPV